jgi:hypothetical protein
MSRSRLPRARRLSCLTAAAGAHSALGTAPWLVVSASRSTCSDLGAADCSDSVCTLAVIVELVSAIRVSSAGPSSGAGASRCGSVGGSCKTPGAARPGPPRVAFGDALWPIRSTRPTISPLQPGPAINPAASSPGPKSKPIPSATPTSWPPSRRRPERPSGRRWLRPWRWPRRDREGPRASDERRPQPGGGAAAGAGRPKLRAFWPGQGALLPRLIGWSQGRGWTAPSDPTRLRDREPTSAMPATPSEPGGERAAARRYSHGDPRNGNRRRDG